MSDTPDTRSPIPGLSEITYRIFCQVRDLTDDMTANDSAVARVIRDPVDGAPLRTLFADVAQALMMAASEINVMRRLQIADGLAIQDLKREREPASWKFWKFPKMPS